MLLTVTLNPAIDKLYTVDRLTDFTVMRAREVVATAGGKGLNVSRVASLLGVPVRAMGFVGGHSGAYLRELLAGTDIQCAFTEAAGETRTCINVKDLSTGRHTEFLEPGAPVSGAEYECFLSAYRLALAEAEAVTLSGSLPRGMPGDCYRTLVSLAREAEVPVLLDASGDALCLGVEAGPTVVKPNADELEQLLGAPAVGERQVLAALHALRRRGIKTAVASLGKRGALAVGPEGVFRAVPPEIQAVNTVGCGDSMLAGLALMEMGKTPLPEGLRTATALAAANALSPGTGDLAPQDFKRLLPLVKIEKLEENDE